jgi:hypothetical protein
VWSEQEAEMVEKGHGTALDRTRAYQQRFVDGTASCAAIEVTSINDSVATSKPANCRSTSPPCQR